MRMACSNPIPTRFDREEKKVIKNLKKAAKASGRKLSHSEIVRRCVRFAAPKFLSGEVPFSDPIVVVPNGSAKSRAFFSPAK